METGKVFKRQEKKYLISRQEYDRFLGIINDKVSPNKFFSSVVMNIYLDTEKNDLIIKSIDRPNFKEKVRIRAYGIPTPDDNIFFEIKTKRKIRQNKNGFKRRFQLRLRDFYDYIDGKTELLSVARKEIEKSTDIQIAKELDYIVKKFQLRPKILISCERKSYDGREDSDLRITFDENLRYRYNNLRLEEGPSGKKYFQDKKNIIMEIKTTNSMPIWLVHALNECKIFPQAFSKYGKIYEKCFREGVENV